MQVEFTRKFEVIDNFAVENFAWNQQRNARWIRCDKAHSNAAFKMVDLNAIGFALGNIGVSVAGLHGRLQVALVNLGRQTRDVVLGVQRMNVLA